MIKFILNDKVVTTDLPTGTTLLDFIRYHQLKMGTKIGCREGDCGACSVLVGSLDEKLTYESATSCLMALGNAHLKHIVTIEGLNMNGLNKIQEAFVEQNASQCGFCTPGFIVGLTGGCITGNAKTYEGAIDSMNGNICRCTGYKSIQRAASNVVDVVASCKQDDYLQHAVDQKIVPDYFLKIQEQLKKLIDENIDHSLTVTDNRKVSGGTDLYVQQHEKIVHTSPVLMNKQNRFIKQEGDDCVFGAATTVSDIAVSPMFQTITNFDALIKLVSSTPIRNMATIAGNFVNASPIGDFSALFLALDAQLQIADNKQSRTVALRNFFLDYKKIDLIPEEHIESIRFKIPDAETLVSFEKVSKRTHLDIASVNTALSIKVKNNVVESCSISAGGVNPIPTFLKKSSEYFVGKTISREVIEAVFPIVDAEVAPISDARGTSDYKRLLLKQLIKAHFIKLFP